MDNIHALLSKALEKATDKSELIEEVSEALHSLKSCNNSEYEHITDYLKEIAYCIPEEEAIKIVRHMEPKGQCWSFNQVKDYVSSQGITDNYVNWYLVMNMCYNDYYNTAKAYNLQNDTNFYFNLAKDFIFDPDAEPFKVEKYFS